MKNRPLLSGCLIGFLLISICIFSGGAKFIPELRPSVLEKDISAKSCVRLLGQIYDVDVKEKYQIIYLKNNSIVYQNESFKESRIIVYDEKKLNIKIGNLVEVLGEISFYEEERNPGNFDQKLYYKKQEIHAFVWASQIEIIDEREDGFRDFLYSFRLKWKEMLIGILGEEEGNILSAMLLAEKSGMNAETKELYQVNGIGHILAISGLHLSVIGIGLYKIFRRLSGSFTIGGIAGISILVLYILMIGVSVSVLRALIMFLFRVGADITGRHYDSPTALGFAAFFTVMWKPLYLLDGGFWLSYGAILAIILVFPMFENLSFQGFFSSVSINIVTLPVLLYYFYEVPLYSVFLNIIIVPFMTVILTCGLAGSLCSAIFISNGPFGINGVGGILVEICGVILKSYEKICELTLELPGNRLVSGQPGVWQIVLYYVGLIFIIVIWRHGKGKLRRQMTKRKCVLLFGAVLLNLFIVFIPFEQIVSERKGEIYITMLDVGQGDAIFVRGPEGNTYLIDGGSSDVKDVGKYRIEPFLKSKGVGEIDYVFVSHGDGDHISGIIEMMERKYIGIAMETIIFPCGEMWDEALMELAKQSLKSGIRVVEMQEGQVFTEGEMTWKCLAPADDYKGDSNAGSMVLALNYREFDMLFTGDVEKEGEESLTEVLNCFYQKKNWEVLKVAHHGSKNSTSEDFLETLSPVYAFISAGRNNLYGHPHDETIERLQKADSTILSTQENGAITVITDGIKMKAEGYVKK